MIGMPIIPIRWEGDNDVRLDASNVSHNLSNDLVVICLVYFSINIIEKGESLHPQFLDSIRQFFFAKLAERIQARILLLGTKPASLPARGADAVGLDSVCGIFRKA